MLPKTLQLCGFLLLNAVASVHAVHFYLDANEKRCFIEELPSNTVVEDLLINPELGIQVEVEEMETAHNVVKSIGPPDGRFTFTSHESGDHLICLSTNATSSMFASGTHIRMHLDIVVGSTKADVEHDRTHVSELASKVRDLNVKLEDIRREQQYQREREADYRDLPNDQLACCMVQHSTDYCALGTCAWQLRHLKKFFEDRKMR
ncbi:emp24/gp25L/p24 family/GOLD-domain-containing protein [Schizophyllum amplum]|uniref:Emp24/gp25L/p24 family/GOLD-domain-containing protein n=1 Tax=Schizophyllum amplum TaxID=97359 RepID=A0A550CK50_9AGAR|nr:emp24/gp25L/p24 family/GOLD-domain-containing protein [Auriculariopsis ampla]